MSAKVFGAAQPLPSDVAASFTQLLSWLLWGCELVLLAMMISCGARLWLERRQPEIQGRHTSTAIVVTLICAAVCSVALPIAATAVGSQS
ncbi:MULTISPECIES: hypothetical protein [unclassified Nocardia]|uniref:hypothetical protein n=1 Tax=unclassified Nocardia TaxID=2637762 RepID=UPI001CE43326|nr:MULTISPECIES: hypothetical protein [unclassified Nocardia]